MPELTVPEADDVLHVGQVMLPVALVITSGLDAVTAGVPEDVPSVSTGVPAAAYNEMLLSGSAGSFFARHIKAQYPGEEVQLQAV